MGLSNFSRSVSTYEAGENELLIHQFDDPELEKFNFYDVLKSFAIQADYWLKVQDFFPEGHLIVLDMKDYTLKILPKVNVMYFKDFLLYLLVSLNEIKASQFPFNLYMVTLMLLAESIRKQKIQTMVSYQCVVTIHK